MSPSALSVGTIDAVLCSTVRVYHYIIVLVVTRCYLALLFFAQLSTLSCLA